MPIKSQILSSNNTTKLRLNLGSGLNKLDCFVSVDLIKFDGVEVVCDIGKDIWPWDNNSVDDAYCSHVIEHLNSSERVHFCNELYRVTKPESEITLIAPHWASCRAYGDLTHQWPPVSEFWFYYLNKNWRAVNAPHCDIEYNKDGYSCDFAATLNYFINPILAVQEAELQQFAASNYKEAIYDIHAILVKNKIEIDRRGVERLPKGSDASS